jgi:hypothetical protein
LTEDEQVAAADHLGFVLPPPFVPTPEFQAINDDKRFSLDLAVGISPLHKLDMAYFPLLRGDDHDEPHGGCGYCSERVAANHRFVYQQQQSLPPVMVHVQELEKL